MTRYPVTLVIADAGPLISLALAERLDLLDAFGTPVATLDVVKAECLAKPGAPGQAQLEQWFARNNVPVEVISSPFLRLHQEASRREASGEDPYATEGVGDAAISWFLVKAPRLRGRGTISLVLTEDGPFGDTRLGRNVHVLSTRPFLKTLENMGIIPSAAAIIKAIGEGGRVVSRYQADRPALTGTSGRARSNWTDAAKRKARGIG